MPKLWCYSSRSLRRISVLTLAIAIVSLMAGGLLPASASVAKSLESRKAAPAPTHPNVKGVQLTMAELGGADPSDIVMAHAFTLLNSWGAHANVVYLPNASDAAAALLKGDAQIFTASPPVAFAMQDSGFNLLAFALAGPRQDYALVSVPSIKSVRQLMGHSIGMLANEGVNHAQMTLLFAQYHTAFNNSTMQIVLDGGQSTRFAALLTGRVDAAVLSHFDVLQLAKKGYHVLYDFTKSMPKLYNDVFYARPTWLRAHQNAAIAINEALMMSMKWFDNHANINAAIEESVAGNPGVTPAQVAALDHILRLYDVFPVGSVLTKSGLLYQQTVYHGSGILAKSLPASSLVEVGPAQQAAKLLNS